jgi:hypothetical protein
MKKRILILLAILALAIFCGVAGINAITANAKGNGVPPATAPRSPTATPETCTVRTGIDGGTVNLRACKGAACGQVLDILTEGASLDIITAGESTGYASPWINVTTARGVAGWVNKKYCEVKP